MLWGLTDKYIRITDDDVGLREHLYSVPSC